MQEILVPSKITPSKYQADIYNAVVSTNHNIVVSAGPGSGKTTTIIEASKLIPHNKHSLFAAFNKSIVLELQKRLPSHVACQTLHSLGMTAIMSHFRVQLKVNEYKAFPFIEEVIKVKEKVAITKAEQKALMTYRFNLRDAVDMARMTLTEWNVDAITDMCMYYNITLLKDEIEDVIMVLKKLEVYNRSFNKKHNYIDFVDMIYVAVTNPKIKLPTFDVVFIDEAQDLNKSQQLFLERIVAPKGRTIVVGDKKQSLYSFAGADIYSFDRLEKRPNTITLPLSISYRCGTNIVKLAQEIYSDVEPCLTNPPGEIRYGDIEEIVPGDMVVCRNNRPLTFLYFELLEKGKNPVIIGSDIEVGLTALISKVLRKEVGEGLEYLEERLSKLKEELIEKGVRNFREHPRYEALKDKVTTIEIISQRFTYMKEVSDEIKEMFKEKENCIKLMTIHKSKGLEADRVFYIERFDGKKLLPSPYANQEWEKIQERNLTFVMITRAKSSLIFINNLNSK